MRKILASLIAASVVRMTGCELIEVIPPDGGSTGNNNAHYEDYAEGEPIPREELFSGILESVRSYSNTADFIGHAGDEDISWAFKELEHKYPEYFWINGYVTMSARSNDGEDTTISVTVLNDISPAQQESMVGEIRMAADRIIADIPAGLDDAGKAIYIHDRLILDTVYDDDGAAAPENGIWGTAYGCLVNKKAVCQGYAEAFLYIMNQIGIEAGVVTGDTADGGHAWNYVNVGGKYYWMDLTWDDPDDDVKGTPIRHMYCLVDDDHLYRSRTVDDDQYFVPTCYSMDSNYYVRHGSFIYDYSIDELGTVLQAEDTYGAYDLYNEGEFMFADSETYELAKRKLFDEDELWDLESYVTFHDVVSYTVDDIMYVIKIVY